MEVSSGIMTAHASTGTIAAPGTRNGGLPLVTPLPRNCYEAIAQAMYTSSAATLAMMANASKPLVMANTHISTA